MSKSGVEHARCPHCDRVHPVLARGRRRMKDHMYRPPGGRVQKCPGSGKKPAD